MKLKRLYYTQIFVLSVLGSVIACSPTRFSPAVAPDSVCDASTTSCVVINGTTNITQNFKVGAGKVDILFVNDNSASMSVIQNKLAARFAGFVENLDAKEIDYKIAITTTDVTAISTKSLVNFANGSNSLTKNDSNRVQLFNGAIVRPETIQCENFIKSAYYTYGSSFQGSAYYQSNYAANCPSNDERGIFAANYIVNQQDNFIRSDAHLNIILISNEDVRSGQYNSGGYPLAVEDTAQNLIQSVSQKYPGKYWEFNSIITKDAACGLSQQQSFKDNSGNAIKDSSGNYVIGANPGIQYAAVSASASQDIDGNAQPRGQILSICESDYSQYFRAVANKISDSSRLMTLKCVPLEAPEVSVSSNQNATVPYQWSAGSSQILFQRGSEGIPVTIKYKCNVGSVQ